MLKFKKKIRRQKVNAEQDWPFSFVETTRARDGYFDIFLYNGTVRVPQSIEFLAENLPSSRTERPPFFFRVCLFVSNP